MPKKLFEGGSLPGVGQIHISEIKPTLKYLERQLGINLVDNTLGSVGKREFSGDIDVAIDLPEDDVDAFIKRLKEIPGIEDIQKTSVIMTKVKIQNYDESKQAGNIRTGWVQIDFMTGDPDWLKTYYHAPHEKDSKYKGVYRNILISAVAAHYNREESEEKIDDGRPVEMERWMWSPTDGLVRIIRTPAKNKKGDGYIKKNNNKIIDGPFKTKSEIVKQLNLGSEDALDSFETLMAAVDKRYKKKVAAAIYKEFVDNNVIKSMGIPSELEHLAESVTEGTSGWFRQVSKLI